MSSHSYAPQRSASPDHRPRPAPAGTPYNTHRFKWLPPTPITNPGLPSMRAAAKPANVDYLY
jgi:UPF0755 protein